MTIYERLKLEHDEARAQFEDLCDTRNAGAQRREELFGRLKPDPRLHRKVEEAVSRSLFARDRAARGEAFGAVDGHHLADGLLAELDSLPKDSAARLSKLGVRG